MGEIDGAFRAWGFAKNGSGGVSGSILNAAKALGVEIRVNASVKQVKVKNGRAVGVVLENGDELDPKSSCLPPTRSAPSCNSSSRNISPMILSRRSKTSARAARRARSTSP
jgi:hypothetical protein